MKKSVIVLFILTLYVSNIYSQYKSDPEIGEYTVPVSRDRSGSCGPYFHGDYMLKTIINKIEGNRITFNVIKYNNGQIGKFSSGTRMYIKFSSSSSYDALVCSNDYIQISRYNDYVYKGTYTARFTGKKYFVAVSVASDSDHTRYYSGRGKIYKEEERCDVPNYRYFKGDNISENSFQARWNSVQNATKYEINVKKATDNDYYNPVYNSTTSSTSKTIYGLNPGTGYKFQVRTKCSSGWSDWSPSSNLITTNKPQPCNPPNNNFFEARSITATSFKAEWRSVNIADLYKIEVRRASNNAFIYAGETSRLYKNINNLLPEFSYKFRVKSKCNGSWGDWSDYSEKITTLEEEQSITITSPTENSKYTVGNQMKIKWHSEGTIPVVIITFISKSLNFSYKTTEYISNNGYYTFKIPESFETADDYQLIIFNRSNYKTYDNVEHITITGSCKKPTGLTAKNINSTSFIADWDGVPGGNYYSIIVKRASDSNYNNPVFQGGGSDTERLIEGLEPNTQYKFAVSAGCGIGNLSEFAHSEIITTKKEEQGECYFSDCTSGNCGVIGNEAYNAVKYLCNKGVVTGHSANDLVYIDNDITRAELAAIAYRGLFGKQLTVASSFPVPYNDLQDKSTYYHEHAKALLYLEYGDGITPFNRNFFNFYPDKKINRAYVLKVLLETYNIKPETSGASPFSDVSTSADYFGYVKAAASRGIINTSFDKFRPTDNCTRAEAFIMLKRILEKGKPNVNAKTDFFIPGNMTPYNIAVEKGLDVGNFNHYTKNCFNIANRGIPMDFSFTYNSYPVELPDEFYPVKPLGLGWTHSYNAYSKVIEGSDGKPKLLIHWPNGSLNIYKAKNNEFVAVTKGLKDKVVMKKVNGEVRIEVYTKDKITYRFVSQNKQNLFSLERIEDRHGNYVKIYYEVNGDNVRVDYVKDQFGRKLSFDYHSGTNQLRRVTDPLGRTVEFGFSNGKLTKFEDAESHTTTYNYSNEKGEENLIKTIRLPKGNIITNSYENRKLTSTKYNNQAPTTVNISTNYSNPTANDFISSEVKSTTPNGNIITTKYNRDVNNNLKYIKDDISTVNIKYEDSDDPTLPTEITNDGISTKIKYDRNGNAEEIKVSGGGESITKRYSFNNDNDITSYTDGNGYTYTFDYRNGNLIRATSPIASTSYDYNDYGQVEEITYPSNVVVKYSYDNPYGYMTETSVRGSNIRTSYRYDKIGHLRSVTDAKGNTTTYDHNRVDAVTELNNALGQATTYRFDANDNLERVINAKGKATRMTYDDNDLLKSVSFAGSSKTYDYYNDGTLKKFTKPNGDSFSYQYDAMGRLKGDGSTTYGYQNEKLKTITYNGKTITYGYDGLNRVNSIQYSDGGDNEVKYTYDNNNNITSITYPGGNKVRYTYDAVNRMKTVTDWNNKTTTYKYNSKGFLEKTTYPNGVKTLYTYNNYGRLENQKTTKSDGSVIAEYTFELDDLGNHKKEILNQPQELVAQLQKGTTTYEYNDGNHLQTAGNTSYNFDDNGDIRNGNSYNYSFNKYGKLTRISGNLNATYEYDGLGNRRKRNNTRYLLDILGLSRVLAETNGSAVQNYYIYGLGLISRIDASNNTNYYVYDFRGSTVAITDDSSSANITHKYAYDDFGKITAEEEADANPFKYVGKMGLMYEDENHYFVRARYYDCNTARFISEDPIWNTNLYTYAENNGVMNVDVDGNLSRWAVTSNYYLRRANKNLASIAGFYNLNVMIDNMRDTNDSELKYSTNMTIDSHRLGLIKYDVIRGFFGGVSSKPQNKFTQIYESSVKPYMNSDTNYGKTRFICGITEMMYEINTNYKTYYKSQREEVQERKRDLVLKYLGNILMKGDNKSIYYKPWTL